MSKRLKSFRVTVCELCFSDWDEEPEEDWHCWVCGAEACPDCRESMFAAEYLGARVICIHCGEEARRRLRLDWPEALP